MGVIEFGILMIFLTFLVFAMAGWMIYSFTIKPEREERKRHSS